MFGMSVNNEIPGGALDALMKYVDSGGFKKGCEKLGLDEIIAMDALITKYQGKAEKIVKRIIEETDPGDIDSVHIGNYAQKADIIRTISIPDVATDGRLVYKHVLIFGDAGVGKSSFVKSLSGKYEMIDVNASMCRTRDELASELQGFFDTDSVDSRPKIVFLDEVDSLAKKGSNFVVDLIGPGVDYVNRFIETARKGPPRNVAEKKKFKKMEMVVAKRSKFPIVMVCNNVRRVSSRITRNGSVKMIKFSEPQVFEIESLLLAYADKYWGGVVSSKYSRMAKSVAQIKQIVNECGGDVRTAKSMLIGGERIDDNSDLKLIDIVYDILALDDRDDVYDMLLEMDYHHMSTVLLYLSVNLTRFYNKLSEIMNVSSVISSLDELKYKTRREYICSALAFSVPPSRFKDVTPVYPARKEKGARIDKEKE